MAYQHLWTPITELANAKSIVTITYWDGSTVPGASYQIIHGSVRISVPTAGRYSARIRTNTTEEAITFDVTDRGDNAPAPIALGVLWAGYAIRTGTPVGIVGLGSSTINGGDQTLGNRWFTKLITSMQSAFPSGRGSESTVTYTLTKNSTAGIHGYNGGVGGTTSANYLTDTKVNDIGAIAPFALVHMVGSNDMYNNMPPATYKANLSKWLDKLDNAVANPHVHILVHAHRRGGDFAYPWSDYRDVLKELSIERTNAAFIDTEPTFTAAKVPSPDTFSLLRSDNVHLEIPGHELMFRLVAASLQVPFGNTSVTQNTTTTTTVGRDSSTILSDSFNSTDSADVAGRTFDNLLGGAYVRTWTSDPAAQWGITGNRLARKGTSNFFVGTDMAVSDYETSMTVSVLPTGADVYLTVRRQSGTLADTPNDYRLLINGAGTLTLSKRVSGTVTTLGSAGTIVAGDRVTLRAKGSQLTVYINGTQSLQVTDTSITTPGFTGLSGIGTVATAQVDNFVVSAIL